MKQILKVFCLSIVVFSCFFNFKAETSALEDDYKYLPIGMNYVNPENFTRELVGSNYEIKTINPFRILPDRAYSIYSISWQDISLENLKLTFYNYKMEEVEFDNKLQTTIEYNTTYLISFISPDDASFLRIELEFYKRRHNNDYENLDNYLAIYEGHQDLAELREELPPPYQGADRTKTIVEPNQSGYIKSNVDTPLSIDDIKSEIYVIDDSLEDISGGVVVDLDDYSINSKTLGLYEARFKLVDAASNEAKFSVFIEVVDTTKPTIAGPAIIEASSLDKISLDEIISLLDVLDNYDTSPDVSVSIDNYSDNYNKIGSYNIKLEASDQSGNKTSHDLVVNVVDKVAPVVTGPEWIYKNNNEILLVEDIINQFQATDDVDGDISSKIKVRYDMYSVNPYKVGSFGIDFEVSDSAGNIKYFSTIVTINDNTEPIFFIKNQHITIELKENTPNILALDSIINNLKLDNLIQNNQSIKIIHDEYSNNKNTPGIYKVELSAGDERLALTIDVKVKEIKVDESKKELNFFEKIIDFFVRLWNIIKNFFINLFS